MVAPKNRTISDLSQWAADPPKMARFEAVALLSQRTAFVKDLLGLHEPDVLVRMQIQAVRARHGVGCRMARGNGSTGVRRKAFSAQERYIASFLLHTLLLSTHGGIEDSDSGLASDNLVDRLIYAYRRFLVLTRTQAEKASLNFENFCVVYQGYTVGKINLVQCVDCGASYVQFDEAVWSQCPLCVVHNHARMRGARERTAQAAGGHGRSG